MSINGGENGKKKRGSWNLFGGNSRKSDGAIVSPLLDSPTVNASYVQPGSKKSSSGKTFSLGSIISRPFASRAVPSSGKGEAHDMYSRLPSEGYEDMDDTDSKPFVGGGGRMSFTRSDAVEMTSRSVKSSAEKRKMNNDVLERQRRNNEQFLQQMREEEDRAIAGYAQRKKEEEESLRLAMQLQAQEEAYAVQFQAQQSASQPTAQQERKRVVVPVPEGALSGQILNVSVPGYGMVPVQVPPGTTPGQSIEFWVTMAAGGREKKTVQLVVPPHGVPGKKITVQIPGVTNHIQVMVPMGAKPGDTIEFNVDVPSTKPQIRAEDVTPQMNSKEREDFLNSLPEDMRNEVLAQERAQRQQLMQTQQQQHGEPEDTMSAVEKKEFYDALPPEIRDEIMAQETAQRRRISGAGRGSQDQGPIDPHAHLEASPAAIINEVPDNAGAMASMSLGQNATDPIPENTNKNLNGEGLFNGMNVKGNPNSSFTVNPIAANQSTSTGGVTGQEAPLLDLNSDESESAIPPSSAPVVPPPAPVPGLSDRDDPSEGARPPPAPQSNNPFAKQPATDAGRSSAPEAPLDRLRKAKELLNEGLIEQAEFDEIKKVVLLQLKGQ